MPVTARSGHPAGSRGKAVALALPAQAALLGAAVCLLDLTVLRSATTRSRRDVEGMALPAGARAELAGYETLAGTRPALLFFTAATALLTCVAVPLWRGSAPAASPGGAAGRGVAAGLLGVGFLTPVYLAGLLAVSSVEAYPTLSWEVAEDLLDAAIPGWYGHARAALLGVAAVTYPAAVCLLARPAATGWRARPAPGTALLLLRLLPLSGAVVTVLNLVAIGQARRQAEETFRRDPDHYTGAGEFYLDQATRTTWTYALALAVAGAGALALAGLARRHGVTAPLLVALGVAGPPLLFLWLLLAGGTPFVLGGASGEPVPVVAGDGPPWYLPAILTQTSLAALAYVVSVALILRAAGRVFMTSHPGANLTSK
ncbi:hypothetical protein [Microtetraspora sp. NBRC 13810]|uniref:hypothetical protein n=1 Tax=Microtetraspora sp. NBRC 13810 TaxID=3030990 RepID=UPI0025530798|nr:hypothetical protein [Microtetraspora sp. NBRC 13810]